MKPRLIQATCSYELHMTAIKHLPAPALENEALESCWAAAGARCDLLGGASGITQAPCNLPSLNTLRAGGAATE